MSFNPPSYVKFHPWECPGWLESQVPTDPEDMFIDFSKYKGFLLSNIKKIDPRFFRFLYENRLTFYNKRLVRAIEHIADLS